MRFYTVHERVGAPVDGNGIVFVREGFCWPALFLTIFWLGFQRLWLALALYVAAVLAVAALGEALRLDPQALAILSVALQVLLAAQANDIRRWTLRRNGYREIGLASGRTLSEAERDFFRRWDGPAPAPRAPARSSGSMMAPAGAVWPRRSVDEDHGALGLFPRAEG